jgi:hypothetical protein
MIVTFIALIVPTLLGFMTISYFLHEETGAGVLERLCLAFPLGMSLLTVQMFLLALMGVPLTLWHILAPLMLEIAGLYLAVRKRRKTLLGGISFDLIKEIIFTEKSWIKKIILIVITVAIGVKLGTVFMETYLRPIFAWDSFANWSASAKAFYYSQSLLLNVPAVDFFGKGVLDRNINYPPHNPLMQVWLSLWMGGFDEVYAKFWSPVYLLCITIYLYLVATREVSRLVSLVIVALFLSSPLIAVHAVEPYSDVPLSAYILITLTAFLAAMRGRSEYWPVLGLFSAAALFTKDEATFFVLPLMLSVVLFLWRSKMNKSDIRKTILSLSSCLLLAAPWFVFKFSHSLGYGADYVTFKLTFRPEMLYKVASLILMFQNFNVFFVFFPILIILNGRPTKEIVYLLIPITCFAFFFLSLYVFTVFFSGRLMFNTAIYRNFLTYYPGICLLTVLLVKNIISRADIPREPGE